jgi:hypothetical protein
MLRACSEIEPFEQYGSKLIAGFGGGTEAAADRERKSCRWNAESVACKFDIVDRGIVGMSSFWRLQRLACISYLVDEVLPYLQFYESYCTIDS